MIGLVSACDFYLSQAAASPFFLQCRQRRRQLFALTWSVSPRSTPRALLTVRCAHIALTTVQTAALARLSTPCRSVA